MAKTTKTRYKYELTEVKLNSEMVNSYLRKAFKTIKEIQRCAGCICSFKDKDDEIDGTDYQIYERNFIINLASKLPNRRKTKEFINGEVAKKLNMHDDNQAQNNQDKRYLNKYIEIKKKINIKYVGDDNIYVFPDFLIHDSNSFEPENMNRDTQHLIMEAKTTKITGSKKMYFWIDFLKLNFYIEKLKFDNALFFILGTPLKIINTYIQNYMDDENVVNCGDDINRIFFIVQEKIESDPKLFTIKESSNN